MFFFSSPVSLCNLKCLCALLLHSSAFLFIYTHIWLLADFVSTGNIVGRNKATKGQTELNCVERVHHHVFQRARRARGLSSFTKSEQ